MVGTLLSGESVLGIMCVTAMLIFMGFPLAAGFSMAGRPAGRLPHWLTLTAWVLFFRMLALIALLWILQADVTVATIFGNAVKLDEIVLLGTGFYLLSRVVIHLTNSQKGSSMLLPAASTRGLMGGTIPHAVDGAFIAFGMCASAPVMVVSVFAAALVFALFHKQLPSIAARTPSLHMLTLGFTMLVSLVILIEAVSGGALRISKTYLYFVIAFGFGVLLLSLRNSHNRQIPKKF